MPVVIFTFPFHRLFSSAYTLRIITLELCTAKTVAIVDHFCSTKMVSFYELSK